MSKATSSESVTAALVRLRMALESASPPLATRLSKPASSGDLAALEVAFGRALPADVRAFLMTTDGDGAAVEDGERIHGLLLGAADCPDWIRAMRWLPAREATTLLYEYRETLDEAFRPSWLPVATDDCGNVAIVDDLDGSVYAIDHEDPRKKEENRIAPSIEALLTALVGSLDDDSLGCDAGGFYRVVVTSRAQTEPAAMLLGLLVDRELLELVPGGSMAEAVKAVRAVLALEGSSMALATKLGELLDSADWVDESFASDEVLELLVKEFR